MDENKILDAVNAGESGILEFKASLSERKDALHTLSAFAWAGGGKVIFGVSKGKIIGVEIEKGTIEELVNDIMKPLCNPVLKDGVPAKIRDFQGCLVRFQAPRKSKIFWVTKNRKTIFVIAKLFHNFWISQYSKSERFAKSRKFQRNFQRPKKCKAFFQVSKPHSSTHSSAWFPAASR